MAQDPQVRSFRNELVGRCILQPHAKDLGAPLMLLVDGPASALEKARGELLLIASDKRDKELKLVKSNEENGRWEIETRG